MLYNLNRVYSILIVLIYIHISLAMDMPDIINRVIFCGMSNFYETDLAAIQNVIKYDISDEGLHCIIKYKSPDDVSYTALFNLRSS